MKNFEDIISGPKEKSPVNRAIVEAANEKGIGLLLGLNDRVVSPFVKMKKQGISLGQELEDDIAAFGATLEPSSKDIIEAFNTNEEDKVILIHTEKVTYEANATLDYLSKLLDIWVDFNQLKEVVR